MDATYQVADKVELIHPARFLFNAGSTPKEWNHKILNDPYFKVLHYETKSNKFFSDTDIKGGVCISYYNCLNDFGAILTYTPYEELNSILKKISKTNYTSLMNSVIIQCRFNLPELYKDFPELLSPEIDDSGKKIYAIGSEGKDRRFEKNIFIKLPQVFHEVPENQDDIKVLGIYKQKRAWRYINKKYVDLMHENINRYKVLVPTSNGTGALGEVLSTPLIGEPLIGYTRSFIGIGSFETSYEAMNCLKYIRSKFSRTCLGILKITQDNNKEVWKYVPLQDFTSTSDIDWSKSIHEIDLQLYKKYGLDDKEIEFIESHVKEMD